MFSQDEPIARLHANEAWAYAQMGQPQQVASALARAEDEMSRADPATAQPWTAVFFSPGDFAGHCALVHGVLARVTRDGTTAIRHATTAAELASTALTTSTAERPARSKVFDRIVLAAAQLQAGDAHTVIGSGHEAVTLTETLRSARATARLTDIAEAAKMFGTRSDAVDPASASQRWRHRPSTVTALTPELAAELLDPYVATFWVELPAVSGEKWSGTDLAEPLRVLHGLQPPRQVAEWNPFAATAPA